MPALECRAEGHGGNRNTKILNLDKISLALSRPTTHIIQWLKLKLKTQATLINERNNCIHRLNGHISTQTLQNALFDLIKEWVLCSTCNNPETFILRSTAGTRLKVCCLACGAVNRVKQRTYTGNSIYFQYLLRECPESSSDSTGLYNSGNNNSNDNIESVDGLFKKRPDIPVSISRSNSANATTIDDDEWSLDVSPEAVAARQADVSRSIVLADVIDDTDKNTCADSRPSTKKKQQIDKLCRLLNYTKDSWPLTPKEFRVKYVELSLDEKRACMVLPYLCRGDQIKADLDKHMKLMEYMLVGKEENQYYYLRELSRYLEILMEDTDTSEMEIKSTTTITPIGICNLFAKLYEEDLIDDVSYNKWYTKGMGKNVRCSEFADRLKEHINPFHEWMQQEEEEEEEDEEDIEFSETANNNICPDTNNDDDDGSDIDIDAL